MEKFQNDTLGAKFSKYLYFVIRNYEGICLSLLRNVFSDYSEFMRFRKLFPRERAREGTGRILSENEKQQR